MSQLYDTMEEGTVLVVVCQGSVSRMVNLMAKKTKSQWEFNKKEKLDNIAGQKRGRAQGEEGLTVRKGEYFSL